MNFHDLEIMSRTVFGEARGESSDGQVAVAAVILNRVRHHTRWADEIYMVCLQEKQFSCWNPGDPNRELLMEADLDDERMQSAVVACISAVEGYDPSNGADHYFATYIPTPSWAEEMTQTAEIGVHRFFKA